MENLIGNVYSDLTVISFHHKDKKNNSYWLCKCICGKEKIVRGTHLKNGGVKSCGCKIYKNNCFFKTTWFSKRLHKIWESMKQRCYNSKNEEYKHYGERGIYICDEWLNNSQKFNDWAIANGYKIGLTIDRKDNNGNYEPSNCRWVDMKTQQNNKRTNVCFEYNGEKLTTKQICEKYNINYSCFRKRIALGWSLEKAITTPSGEKK